MMIGMAVMAAFGVASTAQEPPAVTVGPCQGAPTLMIQGRPEFPLFHFSQEILEPYARAFDKAGFVFYGSIEEHAFLDLGWKGAYDFDFTKLDKVLKGFKERLPHAYLLPKIHLWAPEWWIDAHPDEAVGFLLKPETYDYVIGSGPKHESFASELWQAEASEGLKRLVRHILDGPYADRVMGIMVAGGTFGEWHPWTPHYVPDTSEPMRQAFIRHVRRKYGGDVEALRRAWRNDAVDFDTIAVPGLDERQKGHVGLFRDPAQGAKVVDYYEAFHGVSVAMLDRFCRVVKDESQGRLLTCVDYAYQPDMPYEPQEMHHRAPAAAMRLSSIDMFSSPHSYWHRGLGEHGALRHFPQSLIARGKLFIDEADDRTHLATPQLFRKTDTLWESLQVLRRSFANVVTQGAGMWYMDHTSRAWYADPAFFEDFANTAKWARHAMTVSRESASEVAVMSAAESEFHVAAAGDVSAQFHVNLTEDFSRAGAPFDRFLIEDLEEGLVPARKVYAFWDGFHFTPAQIAAIEKLKNDGRTLMWFFAPGYVTETGLSLEAMEALTGIDFELNPLPFTSLSSDMTAFPAAPPTFQSWREHMGPVQSLAPRFVPVDGACEVWARYADTGRPAVVSKQLDGWRSVYCPTAKLPWPFIQRVYRDAGVHLYLDSGDNLTANHTWLGIHAVTGGAKTVRLPKPMPVFDVIHHRLMGDALTEFTVSLQPFETVLYTLTQP